MRISSPAFKQGEEIPSEYTCDGMNISPEFHIADVPQGTSSLVLIMDDPDVPTFVRPDQMWVHWVVFNMDPTLTVIPKNTQPKGTPGMNTGGNPKYEGPCPPDRRHRYFFKLYALSKVLKLPRGASKLDVEKAMEGLILAKAELMGTYILKEKSS